MFAIIEIGGKQYRVAPQSKLKVDKIIGHEMGQKINFDKVLCLENEQGNIVIGSPVVSGALVEAEIVQNYKDKKIIIFKKRRRQNSRRKNGHRQHKTELKILSIKV
jgi:large subunit ribosomal protein L21